jgi:predicted nucleotidyltransferase
MNMSRPTPDLELNDVLDKLVRGIQGILRDNFLAAYLQGSFAVGDWDVYSDVDFLVAIKHELSETELANLQFMHARMYDLKPHWAQHLEGSYVPQAVLNRYDPNDPPLFYLDNGSNQLVRSTHDNTLVVRWVLREHGITLAGLPPQTLIEPVASAALRREVSTTMQVWGQELLADSAKMDNCWYQPFVVLSYCRMLHTLQTGRVESKRAGAKWAQKHLDQHWADLIQRAWEERRTAGLKVGEKADPDDLARTIDFIAYALAARSRFDPSSS